MKEGYSVAVSYAVDRASRKQRRSRHSFHRTIEALEQRLAPATFVVNSIYDQPAADPTKGAETSANTITLRSAIQAANEHPNDASGPDRIDFNIPGQGVQTIVPFSLWPVITDPVVIDGYTQPGAKPNTLDVGDNAVLKINLYDQIGYASALTIKAGGSTVRGLDVTNFGQHGLTLTDKGGNVIAGNFLGMPPSGSPSIGDGIALSILFGADGNTIGGTAPADRNVISGNLLGVRIAASSNNIIQGNYIGLVPSGADPLGNGHAGIEVSSGVAPEQTGPATGNLIGGTVSGARNVISSNGAGIIFGGDQASLTSGNLVEGNYIGTDVLGGGNQHFRNNGPGVLLDTGTGANPDGARMNTIGGNTTAARNIISGNIDGVVVATAATDNLIQGNYIGTDVTGALGFRDSTSGITVHGNRTTIVDNVISGVGVDGIFIQGGDDSIIQGNLIGTNAAGTASVSNQIGVHIYGSSHVTLGGTTPGARNIISGNQLSGVFLEGFGVGNRIQGNFIGTDINGTGALGNGVDGIVINFNAVGSPSGDTQIGGADPGAGNVIAFNAYNGVQADNSTAPAQLDGTIEKNTIFSNGINGILVATLNARDPHYLITRNSIYSNVQLGIDLAIYNGRQPNGDGVTPNDSLGHVGPNNFQNFPLLTSVATSQTATHVSGTLHSAANSTFRIEFFANADADPSGHGEGQTYLGFTSVTTDASGNASFDNLALPAPPNGQSFVSATATDADGNTSEFSGDVENTPPPQSADLSIAMSAAPSPVSPGGTETYTIIVTNNGLDTAHNVSITTAVPTSTAFVSFTSPSGWTASAPAAGGAGTISASIPQLSSGSSATFTFDVRVSAGASGGTALTADGSVTSDTSDPNTNNNHASAQAVVSSPVEDADLAINVTASPDPVGQGQLVKFTLTVTNNGQVAGGNVVLSMQTPDQTTFQSMTVPSGWIGHTPSVGESGLLLATIGDLDVGATAVFTVSARVSSAAPLASLITGLAKISCENDDSNLANNQAQASVTVAGTVSADVNVAISGDINPATVGQSVTYTVDVTNPASVAATGVMAHVTLPGTAAIVSLGGGSQHSLAVDFGVGMLSAGETRQFQIVVRPLNTETMTLTASTTADPGVIIGIPAFVSTTVVDTSISVPTPPDGTPSPGTTPPDGTPLPGPTPPSVLTAVRYGFHRQSTVLVVSLGQEMTREDASNPKTYSVLVSTNGVVSEVPISKVWYDPQTHQATLRVAKRVYLFHPWQLVVRGVASNLSSDAIGGSAGRHRFVTDMNSHSLRGPSWDAPGASRVGIKAAPAGPLAAWAEKVASGVRNRPIKTGAVIRTTATGDAHPRLSAPPRNGATGRAHHAR
jgi:uncharacterized repeat protein (TIGR01451 family)